MRSLAALTALAFATLPAFALDCVSAQKDMEYVASIRSLSDDQKRARMNAAITSVNATCGTNTPLLQDPPKILVAPPTGIRLIKLDRCSGDSCFDIHGNLYRRYRDTLTAHDGLICLLERDMIRCD